MAVNKVDYAQILQEDTARGHSQGVWERCPVARLKEDMDAGYYLFDDFSRTAMLTAPTITTQADYRGGWKAFAQTTGTIAPAAILQGQGVKLTTQATATNSAILGNLAFPFEIQRGLGALWFEARVAVSSINANDAGILVGLMDSQTLAAAMPLNSGALANANFVGFQSPSATPTDFNTLYKASGVTAVTVETGILATDGIVTTALKANTYIKLGMTFEPFIGPFGANVYSFYINGFRCSSRKVIPAALGTDFPNNAQLSPIFAIQNGSNTNAISLTIDWVECAQMATGMGLMA